MKVACDTHKLKFGLGGLTAAAATYFLIGRFASKRLAATTSVVTGVVTGVWLHRALDRRVHVPKNIEGQKCQAQWARGAAICPIHITTVENAAKILATGGIEGGRGPSVLKGIYYTGFGTTLTHRMGLKATFCSLTSTTIEQGRGNDRKTVGQWTIDKFQKLLLNRGLEGKKLVMLVLSTELLSRTHTKYVLSTKRKSYNLAQRYDWTHLARELRSDHEVIFAEPIPSSAIVRIWDPSSRLAEARKQHPRLAGVKPWKGGIWRGGESPDPKELFKQPLPKTRRRRRRRR